MMTSGLTAATTKVYAAGSTLPACTDPTGQNLPCMMVISTLPPPANALQCKESSGEILQCSYATQNLSNGQEVMVITVYVPANFVFSPGIVKVVTHETEKTVINKVIHVSCPPFTFCPPPHTVDFLAGYRLGSQDGSVGVYDLAAACEGKTGASLEHCTIGYKDAYVSTCHDSKFGCGDGPTACPPGESPTDCHVPHVGPPPGPPPCHGPYTPGVTLLYPCPGITSLPISGGGNGAGSTCAAGNCTAGTTPPTGVDCTKSPSDPSCQQQSSQHHTAAYLQGLNSGAPNPYDPGTKDYKHYQAGLDARQQSTAGGGSGESGGSSSSGSETSGGGSGGSSSGSSSGSAESDWGSSGSSSTTGTSGGSDTGQSNSKTK